MLGAFAVGKTSLVRRFVESVFSDAYLTTVGVKIDKKTVTVAGGAVTLILWDVAGEDEVSALRMSYLRGLAGYLLVADATRPATLAVALSIRERVSTAHGRLPFLLLLNKSDLPESDAISSTDLACVRQQGWETLRTSARTGEGVEEAFGRLAARLAP